MKDTPKPLLAINDLSVQVADKAVLHNLNLAVKPGEVHVLMGPNGSGKSTLAATLMGHPAYQVTNGTVSFEGNDLLALSPDKRARSGLFLSFQHPLEIPGVQVFTFIKEAYRACKGNEINLDELKHLLDQALQHVGLDASFAYRYLNEGFSGGEKKRLEMVQMMMLSPKLALLDEIDSGLDIDALKSVANAIENMRQHNRELSIILITHYQRILEYITPDYVHVIKQGTIVHSGNQEVVEHIEKVGYELERFGL